MDTPRHVTPGRLRRLAEELEDEGLGEITGSASPHAVLDEIDYAVRPPRHEGRRAAYGAIVLPEHGPDRWSRRTGLEVTLSPVAAHADDDARRYADGRVSFALRSGGGVDAVVVFDRSAGSERDLAVLAEATGGYVVQRRGDGLVRVVGRFGVARWDGADWQLEPPFDSWLRRVAAGLDDAVGDLLDRTLRFAVHDLGSAGVGSLLVLGAGPGARFEQRLSPPPPLRLDRPSDLGPLRHVLSQLDGAAVFDLDGTLRHLGVRLVPSLDAERDVEAMGGTRHTAARRYSADDPEAVVVAVSDSGPVTVFRGGRIIGRSDPGAEGA